MKWSILLLNVKCVQVIRKVLKNWYIELKQRYFTDKSALEQPGPGFTSFDMDWMLSEWGLEFLGEGRRRRTDLRRFDKFTQGQWWFFWPCHGRRF